MVDVTSGRLWRADWLGQWSPDGKTIARTRCCVGDGGLDIIDVSTGSGGRIVEGDTVGAAWSPDGTRIAFSVHPPAGGPRGPYIVNRDGSGLRRLGDMPGVWTIKWSSSGEYIAFSATVQRSLYVLHVESEEITAVADSSNGFAWSPDGAVLAFTDDTGLYVHEPTIGNRSQLAAGQSGNRFPLAAGISSDPIWSPDGAKIAFRFGPRIAMAYGAYAGDPQSGIQIFYVVEVEGSAEPKPLPPARKLSWSPDGSRIAYLSEGCITGDWDIYTVDAEGGSQVRLTSTPEAIKEGPSWSPTGSTIAFSTFDKLMLVDADSEELRTLAVSGRPGARGPSLHGGAWSSDGRYIVFGTGFDHGICD